MFSVAHWVYIHLPFSDIPTAVKLVAWNDGLMIGENAPSTFIAIVSKAWNVVTISHCQALIYTKKKVLFLVRRSIEYATYKAIAIASYNAIILIITWLLPVCWTMDTH